MRHVSQKDPLGCQIATCAMVLGISYDEARAFYPPIGVAGYGHHVLDDILANRGFAVARKYQFSAEQRKKRDPWPIEPFADLHWCEVMTPAGAHAVVMLADGTVLDPATVQPRRLSDYEQINSIAGVARLKEIAA